MMRYEAVLKTLPPCPIQEQCKTLQDELHMRAESMIRSYDAVKKTYLDTIKPAEEKASPEFGELAQFLDKYLEQIETFLEIVYTARTVNFQGYL